MKNQGAINIKTIIVIVVMLLVGVLLVLAVNTARTYMTGAAGGSEPKNVVATAGEDGRSASVSWMSDKPSAGVVEYGASAASLLLRAVETDQMTSHRVSLSSLKPNTNYFFRIRVGDEIYDNNGIPFSFKTKEASTTIDAVPTSGPTLIPTVAANATSSAAATCVQGEDYNKDGKMNSLDILTCYRNGGSGAKTTGTVTPSPTAKTTTAPVVGKNCENVDYDKNGVINSLDKIKCLQAP